MPSCPTCGAALDAAARFCPKDGTTIKPDPVAAAGSAVAGTIGDERATRPLTPGAKQAKPAATGDAPDPLVGATVDGRYRIKARLGQGGIGVVYEGEHVETKRPVAIKMLHAVFAGSDEFNKRFEREARAASKLTHPSCVSVIDFGRVDRVEPIAAGQKLLGIPYLVMEFVRGKSLAERLDGEPSRRLAPAEAIVIARGILSALRHAHGLGIVHRDIKPANIMLVEGGATGLVVKLLDFGLAKMVGESEPSSAEPLTQAGTVFGTPGYLSPEQASGKPADARSDLYALGVVLYEMLVGRRPFMRPDPLDVVRDHLGTLPPPPRSLGAEISPELEAMVLKALAKDPAGRWQSAEEYSAALATAPEVQPSAVSRQPSATEKATEKASAASEAITKRARRVARATLAALPLEKKQQRIVGAVVGGVALLFVVVLTTRHKTPPPRAKDRPAAATTTARPVTATLAAEAERHIATARDYQRKLWCSDALEELERALHADALAAGDSTLHETAIACLTPKTRDKAIHFLVEEVGSPARAALQDAASNAANADVRRGAREALDRLPH